MCIFRAAFLGVAFLHTKRSNHPCVAPVCSVAKTPVLPNAVKIEISVEVEQVVYCDGVHVCAWDLDISSCNPSGRAGLCLLAVYQTPKIHCRQQEALAWKLLFLESGKVHSGWALVDTLMVLGCHPQGAPNAWLRQASNKKAKK